MRTLMDEPSGLTEFPRLTIRKNPEYYPPGSREESEAHGYFIPSPGPVRAVYLSATFETEEDVWKLETVYKPGDWPGGWREVLSLNAWSRWPRGQRGTVEAYTAMPDELEEFLREKA